MAGRVFLGLSALIWLPYGVFCFFQPGYLGEAAGLVAASATATTELRSMYGGLQVAIGALAVAALVQPGRVRPALTAIAFLTAGLGLSRLFGAALDGAWSSYTVGAIAFELVSATSAAWLLSRAATTGPAAARG